MSKSISEVTNRTRVLKYRFTERQLEIIRAVCQGKMKKVITFELGISNHIYEHEMTDLYARTDTRCREQLAVWCAKRGLV